MPWVGLQFVIVVFPDYTHFFLSIDITFVCLFDLIPVNNFSVICQKGSSWVEPILSKDKMCLAQGHNTVTPVRLESANSWLESNTLPLSQSAPNVFSDDSIIYFIISSEFNAYQI